MGCVGGAFLLFCGYFITYMVMRHISFNTNAEDLGIMDQALWNTLHGNFLRQTICNSLSDTNCAGADGINRLAIHVDPMLLLIAPLYLISPHPVTLFVIQTIVVGLGAFPAFWLARLRLRSEAAGVLIALVYLLYPVQQQATTYDFHAVTLACALLLFTIYFLYTRRNGWLFTCALLSMACKEEISLVIVMLGLWTLVFQRRPYVGLAFIALGTLWFCLALKVIMPAFSTTGQPLLIGRYSDIGTSPVQVLMTIMVHPRSFLQQYILNHDHLFYLRVLLLPALGLPLLAPWVFVIAMPSLLINMLSSDIDMYSGLYQYNAEIVPILIFASIEALVLLRWCVGKLMAILASVNWYRKGGDHAGVSRQHGPRVPVWGTPLVQGAALLLLCLMLASTLRYDYAFHGQMPFALGFQWPTPTSHTAEGERIIQHIPANASISAQTQLVPHLSQRANIYLFPYQDNQSDYIFLDVTSDFYPFFSSNDYMNAVKQLLQQGSYGIIVAHDSYLLLKRNLSSPQVFSSCSHMNQRMQQRMGQELFALLSDVNNCSVNTA